MKRLASCLVPLLGLALDSSSVAQAEPLKRLSFRDRLYDVTVHQDSVWVVGYPGMLLRSKDGGASFNRIPVPVNEALFSIDFNASGLGAIVGRSGTLLLTSDHGATWTRGEARALRKPKADDSWGEEPEKPGSEVKSEPAVHLFGVDVLENGSMVAVGDFGTVMLSQDRGKTWRVCEVSSNSEPSEGTASGGSLSGLGGAEEENAGEEARLSAVSFGDDLHGFIVGEFGWVLATEDGGLTWKRQTSRTDKILFSILANSAENVIAVGSEGTVIETHDGGKTWLNRPVSETRHFFDVACSGARCAVSGQEGLVLVREGKDAGFTRVKSGALAPLSAVTFVEGKDLVVAGNRGYVLHKRQGARELTRVLGE